MDYRALKEPLFSYDFRTRSFVSPGFLTLDVPEVVKKELKDQIVKLESDLENAPDERKTLAGHLDREYGLELTDNIRYLAETLAVEYSRVFNVDEGKFFWGVGTGYENPKYELKRLWINYAKRGDFNPSHAHTGIFSFVIWVRVPYTVAEEAKRYSPEENLTGKFFFQWIDPFGEIISESLDVDESWEWKMAFFPAKLRHGVHPFYTSDEHRISISGNVYAVDSPIEES